MTRDEYVEVVKSGLVSLMEARLIAKVVSFLPFFATGPLYFILSMVVEKVAVYLVRETEISLFCFYVDLRVHAQGRALLDAFILNQNAKTTDEKMNARENLISTARSLIKLTA